MAGPYLVAGIGIGAAGVVVLTGLWAWRARSERAANAIFVGLLATATFGMLNGVMTGAMLAGSLAALAAWDLDGLARGLDQVGRTTATARLEQRHLERLTVVLALGGTLGTLALVGSVTLGLAGAVGLGGVAILGLRWLLRATSQNVH